MHFDQLMFPQTQFNIIITIIILIVIIIIIIKLSSLKLYREFM